MIRYPKAALPSRSITTGSLREKFEEIARWGFAGVSILPYELNCIIRESGWSDVTALAETGRKLLVHGTIGNGQLKDPGDAIEEQVALTRRIHEETGMVANFCFDPGTMKTEDGYLFDPERSIRALETASVLWTELGIPVGIETWPSGPALEELEVLASRLGDFPVQLLLDTGHLFLLQQKRKTGAPSMVGFVAACPLPVNEVHVHDNDGTCDAHLTLGDGLIDREDLGHAISLLPQEVWITIESRPGGKPFTLDDTRGFEEAVKTVVSLDRN